MTTSVTDPTVLVDPITGKVVKFKHTKGFILTKQLSYNCANGVHGNDTCPKYHNSLIKLFSFEETKELACRCNCHWGN